MADRRDLVIALLNLAVTAAVVVMADPGLRFEVRMRLERARRIAQAPPERVPDPVEVSAMLAAAEAITREAR